MGAGIFPLGNCQNYVVLKVSCHIYPLFTNYWCILNTGVFCFLQMIVACDIIIRNFPLNIVYNAFFFNKEKTQKCRF